MILYLARSAGSARGSRDGAWFVCEPQTGDQALLARGIFRLLHNDREVVRVDTERQTARTLRDTHDVPWPEVEA